MYELKIYRGVMIHDNEEWCKIWRGLDFSVQNRHEEFNNLLLKEHRFTELVVIYSNELVLHNGLRETLTQLRSKYWVVKARNFSKEILRNCIICRKHEGQSYKYPPEPLLPCKCVTCERAFSYCGIDFTGSVFIKDIYRSDNQL